MTGKWERYHRLTCRLVILVAVQFLVLTTIAMFLYPGSNRLSHTAAHYSFTHNFFSDLGATRVFSDATNAWSAILFAWSLFCVGLALVVSSLNYRIICEVKRAGRFAGYVSVPAAVLSGLFFIGTAAAPRNVNLDLHVLFVQLAFGTLFVYAACILVMQVRNRWLRPFTVTNCVYIAVLAGYLVLLFLLPTDIDTSSGLMTQVIGQKLVVYCSIINLAVQAYGMRRHLQSSRARTP